MIRPPGFNGVFTSAADPDGRAERDVLAEHIGISSDWATANQVHGGAVLIVEKPGDYGEGDALATVTPGLPVAVFTADCVPILLESPNAVAAVHAGWRGAVAGIVGKALETLERLGGQPIRAAVGPAIGPCCYEVGRDVHAWFGEFVATTSWGTPSVDLAGWAEAELTRHLAPDSDSNVAEADASARTPLVWSARVCTRCGGDYHSHRRDQTPARQVAITWLDAR